jgi:hypothetical protein
MKRSVLFYLYKRNGSMDLNVYLAMPNLFLAEKTNVLSGSSIQRITVSVLLHLLPLASGKENNMSDPWKHRSRFMTCTTCMWFIEKVTEEKKERLSPPIGRCRRRAPTLGGYPVVFNTDWCGDHKLDEEKVG